MKPFHFAVLFWGDKYREHYFLNCWLRSMMAPGNLPQLDAKDGHKIVVATTKKDWGELVFNPLVLKASHHAGFVHVEIDDPGIVNDDNIRTKAILHQHKWFGELLRRTHDPKAIGSVWSPDQIVCNGFVEKMFSWIGRGHDVVICPVLRQAEEPLLEELGSERCISPRRTAELSIKYLHREIEPFIEPVHRRLTHAPYRLWPMPSGYLLHGFFGLPVFMHYSVVSADYRDGNIDTCLRTGNLTAARDLHIVSDSDEVSVISLTPKDYKNYQEFPKEELSRYDTMLNIRTAYKFFGDDWVRRQMWHTPIRWHSEDIGREWLDREYEIEQQMFSSIGNTWLTRLRFDTPKAVKSRLVPLVDKVLGGII